MPRRNCSHLRYPIALLIALLAATACGDTSPADIETEVHRQEIKGGEFDEESNFTVGLIAAQGYAGGICSGTLIAPNLVLTAQHCIAQVTSEYVQCGRTTFGEKLRASQVYVTTSAVMDRSANFIRAARIDTPPGGTDMCGYDIALVTLSELVPFGSVEPINPRIDIPPQQGEVYTAIGYGHTGDGRGSGVRRSLANRVVQCNGNDCPNYTSVQTSEFYGSDGTCQGDSGGTALDEDGRVIGALSRGPAGCAGSIYSGVYKWSNWMREIGGAAASSGGYAAPFWVETGLSSIPENDIDLDGVLEANDNCPDVANPDQADVDGDGIGDVCDDLIDMDDDGIDDDEDNCPDVANPEQKDIDLDGIGDACDDDGDNDGIADADDNCLLEPNADQLDTDGDGVGDACQPEEIEVLGQNASSSGCSATHTDASTPALLLALLGLFGIRRRR